MKHIVRVRSKQRQELFQQLNSVMEAERAVRRRDAWYRGALWVILKLPNDLARTLANDLIALQPDRRDEIEPLLQISEEG